MGFSPLALAVRGQAPPRLEDLAARASCSRLVSVCQRLPRRLRPRPSAPCSPGAPIATGNWATAVPSSAAATPPRPVRCPERSVSQAHSRAGTSPSSRRASNTASRSIRAEGSSPGAGMSRASSATMRRRSRICQWPSTRRAHSPGKRSSASPPAAITVSPSPRMEKYSPGATTPLASWATTPPSRPRRRWQWRCRACSRAKPSSASQPTGITAPPWRAMDPCMPGATIITANWATIRRCPARRRRKWTGPAPSPARRSSALPPG